MYFTSSVQKYYRDHDYCGLLLVIIQRVKGNMRIGEKKEYTRHKCGELLEKEIHKEIHKLDNFLDEKSELIKLRDYTEMDIAKSQAEKIVGK